MEVILTYRWHFRVLRKCFHLIWIYYAEGNAIVGTVCQFSCYQHKFCHEMAMLCLPGGWRPLTRLWKPLSRSSKSPAGYELLTNWGTVSPFMALPPSPFARLFREPRTITEANRYDWKGPWQSLGPDLLRDKRGPQSVGALPKFRTAYWHRWKQNRCFPILTSFQLCVSWSFLFGSL